MCLEVIVTLAETAPAMMRKESSKYIIQLIGQVLELMATVEDDDDWGTQDDPDETDQERYYYFYWQFISYCAFSYLKVSNVFVYYLF
jgi:hypothetical protein